MFAGLTIGDKVLFAVLAAATVTSFIVVDALAFHGSDVVIEVGGSPVRKLHLGREDTARVQGAGGVVTVVVHDGRVAVTEAACPNRVCVRTGWRARAGEVIVCVPNHVVVRISGKRGKGVRAITG